MEQNIETKDVQRTEYLDKNGLDMLWAKIKENTHNQVEVERNRAVAKENSIIDTKADKSTLDNYVLTTALAEYAKKTDIPAVDTSDFVSKTTTDYQIINSTLGIVGGGGIQIVDYTQDGDPVFMTLGSSVLTFDGNNRSTIELNSSDVDSNNGSHIIIEAYNENPQITLSDRANFRNYLTITKEGISSTDNNANRVYATDGSIADLTQYAKKSEITAGGNVDDVQVNGVSIIENKIANIKHATKESLGVVKVGDGINVTDGTISIDQEYLVDMMSYGVEWDTTVADPACTRIGNPLYHKKLPIQSEYKGCLVKNGKVNYYLDPNDWSRKADGTPSVLDGTDGDVMVHIPKFYGKSGSNGNKRWVRISTTKIDSSWVEIPEMFVSAYRITTYTDSDKTKVASVVNTTTNYRGGSNRSDNDQYLDTDKFRTDLGKPRTSVSRSTMRTNANNSGQELLCYEYYKWIFYWAYVIEYANFNSQKEFNSELTSDGYHQGGLGSGVTNWDYDNWLIYNYVNPITPCGYTNEFGNFSGVKQILIPQTQIDDSNTINEKTLYANRWRGFENPFGDILTNLDGIVLKRDSANAESKVYTTSDSSKFGDDTSVMNVVGLEVAKNGYTKEFDLRETGEIIPQLVEGSESTYKCDYHWCYAQSTDKRTLLVGGEAYDGGQAGLGDFDSNNGVGLAASDVGFRSVVLAAIPEADTSDFVSKTTTDNQSIKSGLNVSNNLNIVDGNNESLIDLSIYNTPYDTHTNSSIAVKSFFDGIVDGQQTYQKGGCMIEMVAGDQRNPYIIISTGTEDSYTGENEMKITKSGIIQKSHSYDEDTNYYFAANGTVNDIYNTGNKDIYRHFDDIDTSISNEGVFVSSYNNLTEETEGVRIKNSGISITNGSQNEVFATDGSIADLTQYVLKSIYDEKITALESRIAALEANHTTE